MIRLGITGNIGSGKSTVAAILAELGAAVVDADKIGHRIIAKDSTAYAEIISAFGRGFLLADYEIDRRALAAHIFADKSGSLSSRLNSITHPLIKQEIEALLATYEQQGHKIVAVEAALLFEAGMQEMLDIIWLIAAPRDHVLERLSKAGRFSKEEALSRLARQILVADAEQLADLIIINDADEESLRKKVMLEYNKLLKERA